MWSGDAGPFPAPSGSPLAPNVAAPPPSAAFLPPPPLTLLPASSAPPGNSAVYIIIAAISAGLVLGLCSFFCIIRARLIRPRLPSGRVMSWAGMEPRASQSVLSICEPVPSTCVPCMLPRALHALHAPSCSLMLLHALHAPSCCFMLRNSGLCWWLC
jgi:hypothetical protein